MPAQTALPPAGARTAAPTPGRRLPTPVRERRPAVAALGLLLVVGGALGSALVVHRSGDRVDVLVARRDILPGERIAAADLGVARVAADGAAVVPASALGAFVGTYATSRVPADTLVNRTMFLAGGTVPDGAAVVGLVLAAPQRPSEPLQAGDVVRAYLVAGDGADDALGGQPGDVLLSAVRVVAADAPTDSAAVSVLVPADDAAAVVAAAAAGEVALARLADGTAPLVDTTVG
ncbi:SAF domain-containing protein [Kineococcus rubinsiae]|uniref:SAF domain-containing protein n=1 Tax=Kineococcus rubinsiae TaxID=2609562 RepID=UPI00142F8932|nr:SAF domain-containing protein [Kineococcus rubinsiae]NIZ93233.1 hypothetical protein [Kineococcus rubinsiae]